jgi:tRNA modification GTPase
MEVGGIMVNLLDTAGICNTLDIVEKIGIERSKAVAKGADVVVMVISASDGWTPDDSTIFQQFWGTDSSSSQTQPSTSGVLAGPMAAPTNNVSVTTEARKVVEVPSILVVNKVDRAAVSSVVLPEVVEHVFFKKVAACAIQQVGMQELDIAILDLVGLGHVTSHGHQWAVNQVCRIWTLFSC